MASDEEVMASQGEPSCKVHAGHCAQSSNAMAEVGKPTEVDGQYGPSMVLSRRTNGLKGTKSNFNTESTTKSIWNAGPHLPPKNPESHVA